MTSPTRQEAATKMGLIQNNDSVDDEGEIVSQVISNNKKNQ